jgi:hypothetical protein
MLHGGGVEGSEPLGLGARVRPWLWAIDHPFHEGCESGARLGTDTARGLEGVRAKLVPGLSGTDCAVLLTLAAKDKLEQLYQPLVLLWMR